MTISPRSFAVVFARSAILAGCLMAAFVASAAAISPSFEPPAALDIAGSASSVAAGDFDGDGRQDLAAAYGQGPGAVSVWLGTGNPAGAFAHQSPDVTVGVRPGALLARDLNGDGRDDLAVANAGPPGDGGDDDVSILLGSPTGLVRGETLTVRDAPHTLDAGDLDGDGDLDLVVANSGAGTVAAPSAHVSVLRGNGTGHFEAAHVVRRLPALRSGDRGPDGRRRTGARRRMHRSGHRAHLLPRRRRPDPGRLRPPRLRGQPGRPGRGQLRRPREGRPRGHLPAVLVRRARQRPRLRPPAGAEPHGGESGAGVRHRRPAGDPEEPPVPGGRRREQRRIRRRAHDGHREGRGDRRRRPGEQQVPARDGRRGRDSGGQRVPDRSRAGGRDRGRRERGRQARSRRGGRQPDRDPVRDHARPRRAHGLGCRARVTTRRRSAPS